MAALPTDRVTVKGETLTRNEWSLIDAAFKEAGIDPGLRYVIQGSRSNGSLSGGTHSKDGAFDLVINTIPTSKWVPLVVALRKRGCPSWVRDKAHGWTSGSAHIHGINRFSTNLSDGAKQQVRDYDNGLDGLAHSSAASRPFKGKDYHPRPKQTAYHMPMPKPGAPAWIGPDIGWTTGNITNIKAVQAILAFPQTGQFSTGLAHAIGQYVEGKPDESYGWAKTHPAAYRADGSRPHVVGKNMYASLMTRWPK